MQVVRSTVRSPSSQATSIGNRIPSVCTDRAGLSRRAPSIESRPSSPRRRAGRVSATSKEASTSPSRKSHPIGTRLRAQRGSGGGVGQRPYTLKRISMTSPSSTT